MKFLKEIGHARWYCTNCEDYTYNIIGDNTSDFPCEKCYSSDDYEFHDFADYIMNEANERIKKAYLDDWECPCCERCVLDIIRITAKGNLFADIFEHHCHAHETYCKRFNKIKICWDCNAADAKAKIKNKLPELFSFKICEIKQFIKVKKNKNHLIDYNKSLEIYKSVNGEKYRNLNKNENLNVEFQIPFQIINHVNREDEERGILKDCWKSYIQNLFKLIISHEYPIIKECTKYSLREYW